MPKVLASVQDLLGRLRAPVAQAAEPSLDTEATVSDPHQRLVARLAELSPEAIRSARIDFDNRVCNAAETSGSDHGYSFRSRSYYK